MSTKVSLNKRGDALKGMLLDELLNELVKFERVMARKSITSAQIEKARSTIRELRLSLEKQIESDSLNEMVVKIDERNRYDELRVSYYGGPRLPIEHHRVYDTKWYE